MKQIVRGLRVLLVSVLGLATPATTAAQLPPTFSVLHGFRLDYKDGYLPRSSLIQAADGNLYGTTQGGGDDGSGCAVHACNGTVFKLTLQGEMTSLHTFGWPYDGGSAPYSGVVEGPDGYLYGTTYEGGATGAGVVYKISKTGTFQKLHDFCQPRALCAKEGENPTAGLIVGRDGNLYGKTSWAGAGGIGTLFRISPSGEFSTIFAFNQTIGAADKDGLVQASDGNFYGSNTVGIWRVTPAGQATQLYRFNQPLDGAGEGELIQAKDGNLYGVTYGPGAVYRVGLSGAYKQIRLLSPAADGGGETNTLVQTSDGNLWGSTAGGNGTPPAVFTITTDGTPVQSTFLDVHKTGAPSLAPLMQASDGKLYGTAYSYGATPDGQPASATVFVVNLAVSPAPPPVVESPSSPTVAAAPPPAATEPVAVEPGAAPDVLADSVRADILVAIDRANAAWANALQTLDGSVLTDNVSGQLLHDDLAELERLQTEGVSQNNVITEFAISDVTLDAPGHAVVHTRETWFSQMTARATGQVVQQTPPITYVETYVVELGSGGWIVSSDDLVPE